MKLKGVYIICGRSGSGKGMTARYLHEKYGACLYRFSHPLHTILADMGIPNTRDQLAKLSLSLRINFGEDIMSYGARCFIRKHPNEFVILEGIRRIHSLESWRNHIDGIIWIESNPDNRYARVVMRGEKSSEHLLTREDFEREEFLESEQSLIELKGIADVIIENNGTKEEFFHEIDTFFLLK